MISLGKHKNYRNPKTKKNIKLFDPSLSTFQDFLNNPLPKTNRTTSRMFSPNKPKMERLNFSNTATSTSFLPPKSIDKHRFSSTNRASMTFQEDFSKFETPKQKQKSSFFSQKQPQQFQMTRRQIKEKTENNAMQRFQQLFRKEANVRVKRIEQQQSKRLVGLLQKTSRQNRQNEPRKTFNKIIQPYLTASKKNIKAEQFSNEQLNGKQKQVNEKPFFVQTNHGLMSSNNESQTIKQNKKKLNNENQEKKIPKFQIKRKNSLIKQKETIQQAKQKQQKQIVKQIRKNKMQNQIENQNIFKKLKTQETSQKQKRNKQQFRNQSQKIKKDQILTKAQKSTEEQKNIYKKQEKTQNTIISSSIDQQKVLKKDERQNLNKEEKEVQLKKKNSFEIDSIQIQELKTFQKIEEKINKNVDGTKNTVSDSGNKNKELKDNKQQAQILNMDIALGSKEEMSKKANVGRTSMQSNKESITIKGSRDMKGSIGKKREDKVGRYELDDDMDLDVVEIGGNKVMQSKGYSNSNKKIDKIKEESNNVGNREINNVGKSSKMAQNMESNTSKSVQKQAVVSKVSATSLAQQVQRMEGSYNNISSGKNVNSQRGNNKQVDERQANHNKNKQQSNFHKRQAQQVPSKQSKQQFQNQNEDQDQDDKLHPAQQLDYLICLVQNLGRYYNKSKQFYSQTESSMVEIVMNHKLAAYYSSQQFYYYLNYFVQYLDKGSNQQGKEKGKDKKNQMFYSLTKQDIMEALQDESIQEAIQDLKSSCSVAQKLIKHTFQKAKIYLKKQQKQLQISPTTNYQQKCLTHIQLQFQGLYTLYEQRKSNTLAERLCYLIETYCLLNSLNEEESKEFEDLQDIGQNNYHQHLMQHKHFILNN